MADTEEKDKKAEEKKEEKPKMTTGILVCLAFSTLLFVLLLVLLFEGKTPARAADVSAASAKTWQTAAPAEKLPFSERVREKIRTIVTMEELYAKGRLAGEKLRETMEGITDAWGRLLNVDQSRGDSSAPG